MERITLADIVPLSEYETVRDRMRARIIETKKRRRVPLGDRMTLLFENRDTVLFQIQEMVRAEHLASSDAIQAEIDVYSRSLPQRNELSATLFIEITEQADIRAELDQLIGVNERLRLHIGKRHLLSGVFEPGWSREDRIAAVQYVKFPLTSEQVHSFQAGDEPVVIEVDHPNYQVSTLMDDAVRQELARELG